MTVRQELLNQYYQNDLKSALEKLCSLGKEYFNTQILNNATLQIERLEALENRRQTNTILSENYQLEYRKVKQSLLQMINDLPNEWAEQSIGNDLGTSPIDSKINWKKYTTLFTGTIILLAAIAELTGFSIKDFFRETEPIKELPTQQPTKSASATGEGGHAIITDDGDVHINYEEPKTQKDSTVAKKHSQNEMP